MYYVQGILRGEEVFCFIFCSETHSPFREDLNPEEGQAGGRKNALQ